MEEQEQKISKYNSGVAIQIRIDSLWQDSHTHSRIGLFRRWNSDLDRIWCELAADIDTKKEQGKSKKSFEEYKTEFNNFETKLKKEGDFEDNAPEGFKTVSSTQIKHRNEHYKILMEKELFLRRLQNVLGKGTAWSDEDSDDFD